MSFTVGQIIKVSDLIALDNAIETEPVDITKIVSAWKALKDNNAIIDGENTINDNLEAIENKINEYIS